jgi:hypothetical protein
MTAGGEVVEDYGHVGLTLRAHPVTFLRADLRRQRIVTCASVPRFAPNALKHIPRRRAPLSPVGNARQEWPGGVGHRARLHGAEPCLRPGGRQKGRNLADP